MFFDTHCHISEDDYEDISNIIKDNIAAGVTKMIISGCSRKSIDETITLIKKYDCLYASIGYHPDSIDDYDMAYLEKMLTTNKIVAIGEIGLDYHYVNDEQTKKKQKFLFELQLKIAEKHNLPVVIHSRDATNDTINILKKYKVKGVIHCFSGSLETALIYIKLGYKLGIGGVVTFKNSQLYKVIKELPLENIVLETDSPYLTPEPYRGKQNSSKYIPIIALKIAQIKNCSLTSVATITTDTAREIFKV